MSNVPINPTAQIVHECVVWVLTESSVKGRTNTHVNALIGRIITVNNTTM